MEKEDGRSWTKRVLYVQGAREQPDWESLDSYTFECVPENEVLSRVLEGAPFHFVFLPVSFFRRIALLLEGIPSACWVINRNRKILAQNRAAERDWGTRVGEDCFLAIHKGKALPEKDREEALAGKVRPGMHCVFCRADEALAKQEPVRCEIAWEGKFWDVFWVPLGKDVYLHHIYDVTPYRAMAEELKVLAITDSLTGVYNRRYFFDVLLREIKRVEESGGKLSVILFDLDFFKAVNDSFGHDVGDKVLVEVTQAVQALIRREDVLARFGGDEFAILSLGTGVFEAASVARRVEEAIRALGKRYGVVLGASFGVAEYIPREGVEAFLRRADTLLYQEKQKKRALKTSGAGDPT